MTPMPLPPTMCAIALAAPLSLWPVHSTGGEQAARESEAPAPARLHELVRLVRHDCGSCHGMSLAGGLGPALNPEALAGRPRAYLQALILGGRAGTAMPPWRGLLTAAEADWIAAQLLEGFPDER